MNEHGGGLGTLTRRERRALRALLIESTAGAGRLVDSDRLEQLVGVAPIGGLPPAAELHRVSGSVLRGLAGADGVPDGVRRRLAAVQQRSSLHHLLITGALGQVAKAFDDAELSWLAMKGPVVAALLYPEVGDRTYGDLDLLVSRRDFPQAMRILEELGYEHTIHNWARAEQMLAGQVVMTADTVSIDLHWHLHYSSRDRQPFSLQPEEMIERARRVLISGVRAPTLDPVDTLLTLAFHAARSDGHRLIWLKDVERAIAVEQPDIDELVSRCRIYGCAPPVGLILRRSRDLLGAEIADDVIEMLTPPSLRATDRFATGLVHPVQLHERQTVTRILTRSARSSAATSFAALPRRLGEYLRRSLVPVSENETDDLDEKASYLDAVTTSVSR